MSKKTFKLVLLFLIIGGLSLSFLIARADDGTDKGRQLELEYPAVSGLKPKTIETGLPEYVQYIFYFSIAIIGFIIFGVLVYSGIQYLTSAGQPAKLQEARKGIVSAFLGAIILVSAVLIFKTINPSLVELELAKIPSVHAPLTPGVYICNYNYSDVEQDIKDYLYGDLKTRIKAINKIREAMGTLKEKKYCEKIKGSQNLGKLAIEAKNTDNTIFILPERNVEEEGCQLNVEGRLKEKCWIWKHGVVLQEDPKPFPGGKRCVLFPEPKKVPLPEGKGSIFTVYRPPNKYHLNLPFNARSVVVFEKLLESPSGLNKGLTLYEGEKFNETESGLGKTSFKPEGENEIKIIEPEDLKAIPAKNSDPDKKIKGLHHNTRSIEFELSKGERVFFAVLLGKDKGCGGSGDCGDARYRVCEVRDAADGDLTASPIGRCGRCTRAFKFLKIANCYPCLEKLYVVKGTILVGK